MRVSCCIGSLKIGLEGLIWWERSLTKNVLNIAHIKGLLDHELFCQTIL